MFEAKLIKGEVWKKLIEAIKDLVQEGSLDCSENGISLQAMDSSHVSLVSLLMRSEGFETYRCDRTINLGINISSLSKMLKCAGNNNAITLKAADNCDYVNLTFESPNNDRCGEYELRLMDLDGDHLGIPETDYKCVVNMSSTVLQRICRDMSTFGDSITITVTKGGVSFTTRGDIGKGSEKLTESGSADDDSNSESVKIEMTDPVSMTYSLKYFNMFAKAAPLSPRVTISLTENVPAVIEYLIEDIGFVRFYLAPKIEDDME